MKLYTEEQVRSLLNKMDIIYSLEDLTPIELPSEQEINEECNKLPFEKHVDAGMYNDGQIDGFELGAKWMKEQILNQNK